jgi:glycosyltransferase involved in cell wall biosynthesis
VRTVPDVSVVYITHRPAPRFDWFVESLARQSDGGDFEVIFVDGLHAPERTAELEQLVRGRFPYRHVPAKPTPWNGAHRLTRHEYFAAASARNTGIVYARSPYVVFADDCSVLMPGWWQEAQAAARHEYVVAGAYAKHTEMIVEDGVLLRSGPRHSYRDPQDVRWELGDDEAIVQISGGHLYGCSFGSPRELLIQVNGLDELCDPAGECDCQLGFRLEWAGARIFYSRRMLTVECEEQYQQPILRRLRMSLEPSAYMRRLGNFGVTHRVRDGWDNLSMIYDILYGAHSASSLGNYYELGELSEGALEATIDDFPREYWFDGSALSGL